MNREIGIGTYTLPHVKQLAGGSLQQSAGLSSVLCEYTDGWDGGLGWERGTRGRIYINLQPIYFIGLLETASNIVKQYTLIKIKQISLEETTITKSYFLPSLQIENELQPPCCEMLQMSTLCHLVQGSCMLVSRSSELVHKGLVLSNTLSNYLPFVKHSWCFIVP